MGVTSEFVESGGRQGVLGRRLSSEGVGCGKRTARLNTGIAVASSKRPKLTRLDQCTIAASPLGPRGRRFLERGAVGEEEEENGVSQVDEMQTSEGERDREKNNKFCKRPHFMYPISVKTHIKVGENFRTLVRSERRDSGELCLTAP